MKTNLFMWLRFQTRTFVSFHGEHVEQDVCLSQSHVAQEEEGGSSGT